jgi:hypothetical protein
MMTVNSSPPQARDGIRGAQRLRQPVCERAQKRVPRVVSELIVDLLEPVDIEHAAAVERVLHGARVRACVVLRVHSFLCAGPVVASSDLIGVVPSNLAAVVAGHVPLRLVEPPVQFPSFDITMALASPLQPVPGQHLAAGRLRVAVRWPEGGAARSPRGRVLTQTDVMPAAAKARRAPRAPGGRPPSRGQPRTCRDLRFPTRARDLRPHCGAYAP